MRNELLCDNDVILKCCCYDLSLEVLLCLGRLGDALVLGSAAYVVADRIKRSKGISDRATAKANFDIFVEHTEVVEPSEAEIALAAEFEAAAQAANLPLDGGESLLLAVLMSRDSLRLLLTGDKRAIGAVEDLGNCHEVAAEVIALVGCLEQLFMSLLKIEDVKILQVRVCRESAVDVALANCFSCTSGEYTVESIRAGLISYIGSVRSRAKRVLIPVDDLHV